MKYKCKECLVDFAPKRKPRKIVLCPKCTKEKNKFTCIKCGTKENPTAKARRKTFLCKECKKEKKELNKILKNNSTISLHEINDFLLEKGFNLSSTGIPYKKYGTTLVSVNSKLCGIPLIMVKNKTDSNAYTDTSVLKALSDDAIRDLKIVINTVISLWKSD